MTRPRLVQKIGRSMAALCLMGSLGMAMGVMAGCQSTHGQTAARYTDDSAITAAVKSKLVASRIGNLTRVDVETTNGTVHLNGIVETSEQKAEATRIASRVEGVKGVDNDLEIQTMR